MAASLPVQRDHQIALTRVARDMDAWIVLLHDLAIRYEFIPGLWRFVYAERVKDFLVVIEDHRSGILRKPIDLASNAH